MEELFGLHPDVVLVFWVAIGLGFLIFQNRMSVRTMRHNRAIQERSEEQLKRSEEQLARTQKHQQREEAILDRIERLLDRFEHD